MSTDYCDLCDLPLSTCVHGMPPAPAAPSAPRTRAPRTRAPKPAVAETPVRRAPRKWHSAETFAPHIVTVLQEAGGELDTEDVFARLEERVEEILLPGDRQATPEGELRWRRAARVARRDLAAAGLMVQGTPGVWQLSAAGLDHTVAAED